MFRTDGSGQVRSGQVRSGHMNDLRGSIFEDWMAERCMVNHTYGNAHTFLRGSQKSHINLTLSTEGVPIRMKE